ncbi:glycosyltransferase [Oscillatoria sp. CS-180]|uniref:glycosyltransferase n=1 Tax=Oscillatoria sp. CS-180 TaxID=3021720 RepID=UPI00232A92E3|nr:glycosyltransferase [Oscillatoria sp. CS-180]MDB9525544.1 glycosyltransferase [Oscillatoria sp. CS-180]
MHEQVLQVFPSVLRSVDGQLLIDIDWLDALKIYLKNFEKVTLACPVTTDNNNFGLQKCYPVEKLSYGHRLEFLPLPEAFKVNDFIKNYSVVRSLLSKRIQESQYLEFSPHALVGDWAAVACLEAIQQDRPYVISADVVYHKVAKISYSKKPFLKRFIKDSLSLPLMKRYHEHLFRQSHMALIQGQDAYNEYSRYCRKANLIYHVTVTGEEKITPSQLEQKAESVLSKDNPLRICYAGRAAEIKGPLDWIRAIDTLVKSGTPVQASWIGDGPLLSEMRDLAESLGISDHISFPGYVAEREKVVEFVRNAHIFLFCHKTPESPRCLIEALALGCAIIGYESAYPVELVNPHGGGEFVDVDDWQMLAKKLSSLDTERQALADLIRKAAQSGNVFDRTTAHQNRIDLIRATYQEA